MSQPNGAHPEPSAQPESVRNEAFEDLLVRGRARGSLTADEVMTVLRDVELSRAVIDSVRRRLAAEGIELDESIEDIDEMLPTGTTPNGTTHSVPQPVPNPGRTPVRAAHDRAPERAADGSALGGRADSARTGGSSDPVRTYLKEIGKVAS